MKLEVAADPKSNPAASGRPDALPSALQLVRSRIAIVGAGFVADFYAGSIATFPELRIVGVYDRDPQRLLAFCSHWGLRAAPSLEALLGDGPDRPDLVLNLTNPSSHFEISLACLQAGHHVYSEKPLADSMDHALALHALADRKGLLLASAPCSVLGRAAQTVALALRRNEIGKVRLVYAELDDDFVPQAPYRKWRSSSGAPWPYRDEFRVGCTLEHAGYYLSWLIAMFGSVAKVVAASAELVPEKLGDGEPTAPDFSCATLFFRNGVVARLTCSIVAPHNHSLRIIGDEGVLEVDQSWDNAAAVRVRRRYVIRRRLVNSPIARRIKIRGATHPDAVRFGATAMNFALGPKEVLASLDEGRPCRLSSDFGLHLNEVSLAIQEGKGATVMRTTCPPVDPMPWASAS